VRAAVAPDRVVAESPDGFALREGRIVAAGVRAMGTPIGWIVGPA
jgi:hypothetical protein